MPAVQTIRKTIATLLAAQLFAVFGLCGFVCCLPAQASAGAEAASPGHHASQAGPHDNPHKTAQATKGHCHDKSGPAAPVVPAQSQAQAISPGRHCHGGNFGGRSVALASSQICQCDFNSQERPATLTQPEATHLKAKSFGAVAVSFWQGEDRLQPAPSASPPILASHAPPFGGYQLSLRI